jgi:hypothetical protein
MPNPQVIRALKASLEWAEENNAQHVAISLAGHVGFVGFAGDVGYEEAQLKAQKTLIAKLEASIDNWQYPPRNEDLDESWWVYNITAKPLGFDFLVWLVNVEMKRRRSGAPSPLKIGFWWGRDRDANRPPSSKDHRQMWLDNVYRPSLGLLGAIENDRACVGHRSEIYTTKEIIHACRAGETVPRFECTSVKCDSKRPYVTITLREATHWPHRNSDIATWHKFATDLKLQGEQVVFVRDTEKAHEPIAGFETAPYASHNIPHRCSLYANARANLFVSNGPATLCVFGKAPWLMFTQVEDEASHYRAATPSFLKDQQGLDVGEQYPWSASSQRLVWQEPTYRNLHEAWEQLRDNLPHG